MLGLDYRSDSEDEAPNSPGTATSTSKSATTNGAIPGSSSKLQLPPPGASTSSQPKGLSLPPPKTKQKKSTGPKKIVVELPKLEKHASDDDSSDEQPAAKKPKLGGGAKGASALLSMLPAPKKTVPEPAAPQRVLGGGKPGVVYSAASQKAKAPEERPPVSEGPVDGDDAVQEAVTKYDDTTTSMIPPSMLLKGKSKIQTSEALKASISSSGPSTAPAIDIFSLGSAPNSRPSSAPPLPDTSTSTPLIPSIISSAPKIEEFRPPSPKINDPYPGYYQLPSGSWAMHDPTYYKTYSNRWQKDYEAQIRAYERGEKGFEGAGANGEDATEVNAEQLADAARAAREEKKAITEKAGSETDRPVPKAAMNPTKMSGVARSRHQLHSLLADAFMNREALEEKIAQGKRNRKEAGNKYGF
ncbi:uncharacterized protein FOMMEDRAFT_168783 [Fomitiporia mediterranea MF3/22]|uniref:uncharacterized protein n=1 Tax=Fomitiporia mediterranea (strain MF3/22) TaxID=694068 RepID=UPI00044075D7|nr:uncharacterized protein FOMMEDRAFT_168783 [Fomitiporia mediterranea MF3/22]EJD02286.1 hypothetical protein FOMMEDRAFT_168783 [Fomitiporia mediterranea MF3/22]